MNRRKVTPEPEPKPKPEIEIVLTASVKTIPLVVTIWKYPSGDVTQVVYDKTKLATLPQAMRQTLEKAWATLEDLRGHKGEIIDT